MAEPARPFRTSTKSRGPREIKIAYFTYNINIVYLRGYLHLLLQLHLDKALIGVQLIEISIGLVDVKKWLHCSTGCVHTLLARTTFVLRDVKTPLLPEPSLRSCLAPLRLLRERAMYDCVPTPSRRYQINELWSAPVPGFPSSSQLYMPLSNPIEAAADTLRYTSYDAIRDCHELLHGMDPTGISSRET